MSTKICKKVSAKLHALARISNFMSYDKLRLLMKSFVEIKLLPACVDVPFHSRTLNNRMNKLHEREIREGLWCSG